LRRAASLTQAAVGCCRGVRCWSGCWARRHLVGETRPVALEAFRCVGGGVAALKAGYIVTSFLASAAFGPGLGMGRYRIHGLEDQALDLRLLAA
jgi:hypothetical protein